MPRPARNARASIRAKARSSSGGGAGTWRPTHGAGRSRVASGRSVRGSWRVRPAAMELGPAGRSAEAEGRCVVAMSTRFTRPSSPGCQGRSVRFRRNRPANHAKHISTPAGHLQNRCCVTRRGVAAATPDALPPVRAGSFGPTRRKAATVPPCQLCRRGVHHWPQPAGSCSCERNAQLDIPPGNDEQGRVALSVHRTGDAGDIQPSRRPSRCRRSKA